MKNTETKKMLATDDGQYMNATQTILGPHLEGDRKNKTAIIFHDQVISYKELNQRVNQFGNALKSVGVEVENRVLFMMKDTPNLVAAYLGTMKIGAVSVAYNVRASEKDLLYALLDSRAKVLIIDAEFLDTYRKISSKLPTPLKVIIEGAASEEYDTTTTFIEGHSPVLEPEKTSSDDMAFWLYTSGTTGKPKACVHVQHDILQGKLHLIENLGVKPGDKVFSSSKLFFTYAVGHIMMGGLAAGAEIILYDGWPDAKSIGRIIEKYKPHLVFSVPTLYNNLLHEGVAQQPAFKKVRHYISAGEKLPTQIYKQWLETTGVKILEGIGCSETFHLFMANTPGEMREGSCGKVTSWAQFKILDEKGEEITEAGIPGIGWALLESNTDRYWNQQAKSHEVFSMGWYCTNDMFSYDADGFYYHHGRADDMLKISGQWVSPTEIEDVVLKVSGVKEAAIIGKENEDGLNRLSLYVVPGRKENSPGLQALTEAIKSTVKAQLSIYKCPRDIQYIDNMPRTDTGKLQRFKLHERDTDLNRSYNQK